MKYVQIKIGLILLFISQLCWAQQSSYYLSFVKNLNEVSAKFILPKKFHEINTENKFPCGDYKISNTIMYGIANKDSSIKIVFSVIPPVKPKRLELQKLNDRNFTAQIAHFNNVKDVADTINDKIIHLNDFQKANYNVDVGAIFTRNCPIPYENKYRFNRILYLYKEGFGHIEVTYFYNKKNMDIDALINETSGLIKYN